MRKEIERAQVDLQEEKRLVEQERVRVEEKRKERENFFKEKAHSVLHLYLEDLQQSGAIEVLEELNEEMKLNSMVEVEAAISVPVLRISDLNSVDISEGDRFVYLFHRRREKGKWKGGFERQRLCLSGYADDSIFRKYKEGSAIGEYCCAKLNWGEWDSVTEESRTSGEGDSYGVTTRMRHYLRFAFYVLEQPPGQFIRLVDESQGRGVNMYHSFPRFGVGIDSEFDYDKRRRDKFHRYFFDSYRREVYGKKAELFCFPREQWIDKGLLRGKVAQAYVYLEDIARSNVTGEIHYYRDISTNSGKVDAPEKKKSAQPETSLGRPLRKLLGR